MARRHLAIFLNHMAEKILVGEKQIDVRLSISKIVPYLSVQKEDEILLKIAGGKIIGAATVDNCLYYDNLTPVEILQLKRNYNSLAVASEDFWSAKSRAKFATVIFLKNPRKFLTPVVYKKNDRRGWVVLDEK